MNSFVAKFTMFWILKKGLQKYGIPKYEITKLVFHVYQTRVFPNFLQWKI